MVCPQLADRGLPLPRAIGRETDGLTYRGDSRGKPARDQRVSQRSLRLGVDQFAGSDEPEGDLFRDALGEGPQLSTDLAVEAARVEILRQRWTLGYGRSTVAELFAGPIPRCAVVSGALSEPAVVSMAAALSKVAALSGPATLSESATLSGPAPIPVAEPAPVTSVRPIAKAGAVAT